MRRDRKLEKAVEKAMIEVRQMIRDAMGIAGINQAELARRTGLTQGRISQLLNSARNIRIGTLARLLCACGMRAQIKLPRLKRHS